MRQQLNNNQKCCQHLSSLRPQALVWYSHHIEIIRRLGFLCQHDSRLMKCRIIWQEGCWFECI